MSNQGGIVGVRIYSMGTGGSSLQVTLPWKTKVVSTSCRQPLTLVNQDASSPPFGHLLPGGEGF